MIFNINKINRKKAFSLAEVLISLLILSIILLLAFPAITKKNKMANFAKRGNGAVFLFQQQSTENPIFPCYVTSLSSNGMQTIVKDKSGKCQRYEFVVPSDVHKIDLTLVAGGGGGGGAAGGTVVKKEYMSGASAPLQLLHSRIKKIVIDALVSSGEDGHQRDTVTADNNVYAGKGGSSGNAILNHELPRDFIFLDYKPSFLTETTNSDSSLKISFGDETKLGEITAQGAQMCNDGDIICKNTGYGSTYHSLYEGIQQYEGFGVFFESSHQLTLEQGFAGSAHINTQDSRSKAGIFLADASVGRRIQAFKTSLGDSDDKFVWTTSVSPEVEAEGATDITVLPNDSKLVTSLAKLSNFSFIPSVEGKTSSIPRSGKVTNGCLVKGGEGAKINILGKYGAGGRGEGAMIVCENTVDSCYIPLNNQVDDGKGTHDKIRSTPAEKDMNNQYGKLTAYLDNPGGTGSGGVGGTAIKINNFPVVPGSRYTIVVGAGGAGGTAGKDGQLDANSGAYDYTPTKGQNGAGGACTAIYDGADKLVLLVIGGAGGYGGNINTNAQLTLPIGGNDFTNYAPMPLPANSARNYPLVISGKNGTFDNIENLLDNNIVFELRDQNQNVDIFNSSYKYKRIVSRYAFFDNNNPRRSPYFELNSNSAGLNTGEIVPANNIDDKIGGFNAYETMSPVNINDITKSLTSSQYGLNTSDLVYLGFYSKSIVNNQHSYMGGLGGFSGLGTKGGCGGLFAGNNDGLLADMSHNDSFKGTMIINTVTTTSGGGFVPFYVDNYYGNCTMKSSDGQTAKFIAPSYSSATGEKLGSAGSGGGGGGYNSELGPGKGGDGQNGYVMINWHYQ